MLRAPRENRRLLIRGLSLLAVLALVGYALFATRFLIEGPVITIETPQNGMALSSSLITIAGEAKNIVELTLNDRKIFMSPEGKFSDSLLLSYGYNRMTLRAEDRFGRRVEKILDLTYH